MNKTNIILLATLLFSCTQKKGIEGNNNSNNNIYIGEQITVQEAPKSVKSSANYEITAKGVGGLKIGMSLDTIWLFYNANNGYKVKSIQGTHNSCDLDYIVVNDSNENQLFYITGLEKIRNIVATSEKFHTYNGVTVGMTIEEFEKIYPSEERLYYDDFDDIEYFLPFDLQTKESDLRIIVSSDDKNKLGSDYPQLWETTNGLIYTTTYRTKGKIIAVSVSNPIYQEESEY